MMLASRTKKTRATSRLPDSNKSKSDEKCINSKKQITTKQNKVMCNLCIKLLHLNCTSLTEQQFQGYRHVNFILNCFYCTNYTCLKGAKHIYNDVDSVCYRKCDKWIHRGCTKISKEMYEKMQQNSIGEEI